MGNVLAAGQAQPQSLALEEETEAAALLRSHLARQQASNPHLRSILARSGSAAAVCGALNGGAGGAGGSARDGFTALHVACACGWEELVEKLIEAGHVDVDAASREGYSALHIAAMCGHAGAVSKLLAAGAQLGRRSRRGSNAISFAAQARGNLDALRCLLSHPSCTPALVKQLGYRQRSPLVSAVLSHGHGSVVRALVGAGANPSETCASMAQISVLHTCAHLARVDAMRELVAAGAQVNAAAEDGISVLQECFVQAPTRQRTEAAKREMFSMLVAAGANVNSRVPARNYTVLHFVLASCREEATANLLLDSGVDLSIAVNAPVALGDGAACHTLLHLACMRGWARMVERLVLAGADMSLRNKDGLQPLHSAVLGCHSEVVATLLRLGADPLSTCPDCYPSFAKWKLQRGLQAMQALMQAEEGADIVPALHALLGGTSDSEGPHMTAVDLACCVARHIPTLESFLERGVAPSPAALALAEHAVPIMRVVVERPLLTPQLGARLPQRFRAAAREALLCLSRPVATRDGRSVSLTPDAVAAVLQRAAFPVSAWADAAWLAAQQVREPPERAPAPPAAAAGAPAQPGGAPPGGGPAGGVGAAPGFFGPGVHVLGPGDEPPPFVQAMLNQMQQQMGPMGGAPPHIIIMHHPAHLVGGGAGAGLPGLPGMGMMQQAAAAAAGGPFGGPMGGAGGNGMGAGAGAGIGAGAGQQPGAPQPGPPQQPGAAGLFAPPGGLPAGVHIMEFPLGMPVGMAPPPGMAAAPGMPAGGGPAPGHLMHLMEEMLGGMLGGAHGGGELMFDFEMEGEGFEDGEDEEDENEEEEEDGSDDDGSSSVSEDDEAPGAAPIAGSPQVGPAHPENSPAAPASAAAAAADMAGPSCQQNHAEDEEADTGPSNAGADRSRGGKRPASAPASPRYCLRDRTKRHRRK